MSTLEKKISVLLSDTEVKYCTMREDQVVSSRSRADLESCAATTSRRAASAYRDASLIVLRLTSACGRRAREVCALG